MENKIEIPYKTAKEEILRDYYMYFIENNEGITEHTIKLFRKDVEKVKKENFLYKKREFKQKSL